MMSDRFAYGPKGRARRCEVARHTVAGLASVSAVPEVSG